MRYTVKSHEIGHLWAHQTQSHATAGSMSFDGPDFKSYSTVIATMRQSKDSERVYIVNEDRYSVTTSSHQREVRAAIPVSAKVFMVPGEKSAWSTASWQAREWGRGNSDSGGEGGTSYGYLGDSARIMGTWLKQFELLLEESNRSREPKKTRLLGEAAELVVRMERFCDTFKLPKSKFKLPKLPVDKDELAKMMERKRLANERREKARQIEELRDKAERIEKARVRMAAWLMGGRGDTHDFQYLSTELRIVGDEIETSRGVSFPIEHAKRGLLLVELAKSAGVEWKRNSHTCHLGHYQIDRIESDGTVHAGCHVVPWSAIERIADEVKQYVSVEAVVEMQP